MSNSWKKIMINGVMTSEINVMDRGLQYGDGLFETMVVVNGEIPLWNKHWQRLAKGCDALSIPLADKKDLENQVINFIQGIASGVIKLIITRGIGRRGYVVSENMQPEVILISSDYPDYPESYYQHGVNVRLCKTRLAQQPALAGLKHLNRLEQVIARNEWTDPNITECIMLDTQDNVIEGTMSNLFIVKNEKVLTADLKQCGVAGVMRETVVELLSQQGIACEMTNISQAQLQSADEVFLTNSVIGLWPVKKIDDTVYQVGKISRDLQNRINALIKNA